jgi:nucleotide-binding universal stress UspA family protein
MNVLVIALDAGSPVVVPDSEVLVVSPALNSRLRRWLSDEDDARRLAGERADATVERLERRGLHAHGQVGDADPLQAIADALPVFAADEIVIAGHPERRPNLAAELAAGARARFGLPVLRRGEALPCPA